MNNRGKDWLIVKSVRTLQRTWFTGVLYFLAGIGYTLYTMLFCMRMIHKKIKYLVLFCFIIIVVITAFKGFYLFFPQQTGNKVELIIEPGMSVREIARRLVDKKIISSEEVFLLWIKIVGREKNIQAGLYTFYEREGIFKSTERLQYPQPIEKEITIPEGLTIEQTAQKIAAVFSVDSAQFVALCFDTAFTAQCGIAALTLEGYLFPDTYKFEPQATAREIIIRMVAQFKKEYAALEQTSLSKTFTQHEIVILASIIEKEATLPEERPRISGVFHNRLRLNMPLGADPTIRFALKKFNGPLRVSELRNPTPYNTRIHSGLPPGPICSPGRSSLQSACMPLETKELYFVAKWDGSGAHDFSTTHAQHNKKKLEIRRRNNMKKRSKEEQKP